MKKMSTDRSEVEKHIRAVLSSSPAGLTPNELCRDYIDFIGSPLPFRTFGYKNIKDFLTDIPHIISVTWNNGQEILKATPNKTTEHIQRLVSRQKVTNKNKWAALRNKSNTGSRPYRSSYHCYDKENACRNLKHAPQPVVSVSIRHQIKQMFTHTRSLPLTHFDGFFYKRFGFHIDHLTMGFPSIKSLLDSIPDTVTLVNQYGEWRVLSSYRTKSANTSLSGPSKSVSGNPQKDKPAAIPTPEKKKENTFTSQASPIKTNQKTNSSNQLNNKPTDTTTLFASSTPNHQVNSTFSRTSPGWSSHWQNDLHGSSSPEPDDEDPVHKQVRQVLASKPRGLFASRLAYEYKAMFNKELPFKQYGYHSVIEFVSDLTDVVRIERPNPNGDWVLFDCNSSQVAQQKKPTKVNKQKCVSHDIKAAITQVLQLHHPNGIPISKFQSVFQELTGKTIDPESMGFASFESMILSLTDDVLQATYKGQENMVLTAKDMEGPRQFDQLLEKFQPHCKPVPPKVKELYETSGVPNDCVLPGTYYNSQPLPDCIGDYIELYVSNIVSPGLFWFQLRGKQTTMALETLMDDLSDFYMTSDSQRYLMPQSLYMIGQVCAVLFPEDNNWHRGIITGIKSLDIVEVYYVDYGNTCSVQKDSIRLLRSRFRKLPAQAVQGRLAHIKPVKETWSLQSRDRMLSVCLNRPLVGLVTAVRDRVMSLCLTDTSQLEDIHLNDLLVEEQYAVFAPDELHPSTIGPTQLAEVPGDDLLFGFKQIPSCTEDVTGTVATDAERYLSTSCLIKPPDLPPGPRYVQVIAATDNHVFHLINFNGEAYLVSAEISALFWKDDVISSELIKKDISCPKVQVMKSDNEDLFYELLAYGIAGVDAGKQVLSLYPLNVLPKLLDVFHHPSSVLKSAVDQMICEFNPEDKFWEGIIDKENFNASNESTEDLDDPEINLEDLQLTLKAIQCKRKRILEDMMSHTGSTVEQVNQLHEVEVQIAMTTEVIEEIEKLNLEFTDIEQELEGSCRSQDYPNMPELEKDFKNSDEELESTKEDQLELKTNRVAPLIVKSTTANTADLTNLRNVHDSLTLSSPNTTVALPHQLQPNPSQQLKHQQQQLSEHQSSNHQQQPASDQHQQQNYLLNSMLGQQITSGANTMVPTQLPYQQMNVNPLLSQLSYLVGGSQTSNPYCWPNMDLSNPALNMGMGDMRNQSMNFLRMPNPGIPLPATNFQNFMNASRLQAFQQYPGVLRGSSPRLSTPGMSESNPFQYQQPPQQPIGMNVMDMLRFRPANPKP